MLKNCRLTICGADIKIFGYGYNLCYISILFIDLIMLL